MEELMRETTPNRRKVLKTTGAALAAGTVGAGIASADTGHCPDRCDGSVTFDDQTVANDTEGRDNTPDAVIVQSATLPCGGFIDIHDDEDCGPSGCFGKGYPLGVSDYLAPGTYQDVKIDLFEPNGAFGECIDWNRNELTTQSQLGAMLHLDVDPEDKKFTHYCHHDEKHPPDHAYKCNGSPIQDHATVSPD